MKLKISKEKFLDIVVVFFLILYKYVEMWSYLFNNKYTESKGIIILVSIVSFIIIYEMKFLKEKFLNIVITTSLCIIVSLITKSTNFIIIYLFALFFSKQVNGDKKFLKCFMWSSLILFITTLFLDYVGVLPKNSVVRLINGTYINRNNLGFYLPNTLFLSLFPILICYLVLYYKNYNSILKKVIACIIILFINFYFYKLTNCRTGMICVLIALILINIDIYKIKLIKFISKYYLIIFLLISLFCIYYYGADTTNSLNRLLSGRLYYLYYIINNKSINLLGNIIDLEYPLDNIYIFYLYIYGIIVYLILLIISILSSSKLLKSNSLVFALLMFAIYGLFENNMAFNYNYMLVLQLMYLLDQKNQMYFLGNEAALDEKR